MSDTPPDSDLFPSGPWTGFFLDRRLPGRHQMELRLTFATGRMTGEGRDRVGKFTVDGVYSPADGRCSFTKEYLGSHAVHYAGFNEGKGIWGVWEIESEKGGFHIWPEGMADPTVQTLKEEADVPVEVVEKQRKRKPQPIGGGGG
jgi:hypothetical protein